jgi:ADP-ribose pyrophosphatase YjhB (NUDIX family)
MLNIKPPNFRYCPFCGNKLVTREDIDGVMRKYCARDDWTYYPHVFDSAVPVITKGEKVLLVKRAIEPHHSTWNLPGGFVEYGEHPEETVVREIKEETGLKAVNPKLIEVFQSIDDPRAPGHLIFFYKVKVEGKTENTDNKENQGINWFSLDKLPQIGWESHKYMLKKLRNGEI